MDLSQVDPVFMWGLFIVAVVSVICMTVLHIKRSGVDVDTPYDTVDKVLWTMGAPPLALLGIFGLMVAAQTMKQAPKQREGDDDLVPDEEPTDPNAESRTEQIVRIIEDNAEKVEEHVLEEATDDEVGARGAALFGVGPSSDSEGA